MNEHMHLNKMIKSYISKSLTIIKRTISIAPGEDALVLKLVLKVS